MTDPYLTSHFDLQDELRQLQQLGVVVPVRSSSLFIPRVHLTKDGVEYVHNGKTLYVPSGAKVDTHGNVIDLEDLRRQSIDALLTIGDSVADRNLPSTTFASYTQPQKHFSSITTA